MRAKPSRIPACTPTCPSVTPTWRTRPLAAGLYQGWQAALLQAPLSRFGDTAANAGTLAVLAGVTWMPEGLKTFFSSWAAAAFRILITPIDALKTTLQVQGAAGLSVLSDRISTDGIMTLWSGALATSMATFMGHYPWFVVHNYLEAKVPKPEGKLPAMCRNAFIGLCSSAVRLAGFESGGLRNGSRAQAGCEAETGWGWGARHGIWAWVANRKGIEPDAVESHP